MAARAKYVPMPRHSHSSAQIGSEVLVYSGWTHNKSEENKRYLASVVEAFDPLRQEWEAKKTTGETPDVGVKYAMCASANNCLYTYGGWVMGKPVNSLHQLNTQTNSWRKLPPQEGEEEPDIPMAKIHGGMTAFGNNSLALLGGYGIPHVQGVIQHGSSFIEHERHSDGRGWTNEFHIYNLNEGVWHSPNTTGERPPPCQNFSFTSVDHSRAVVFGGYNVDEGGMNNVYVINLQTMNWTKLRKTGEKPWPEERSYHAACCLNYGQLHPQLLVIGGENKDAKGTLGDAWILDVDNERWRKVKDIPQALYGLSATAVSMSPQLTLVTMFGGTPKRIRRGEQVDLGETTVLKFELKEGSWELVQISFLFLPLYSSGSNPTFSCTCN